MDETKPAQTIAAESIPIVERLLGSFKAFQSGDWTGIIDGLLVDILAPAAMGLLSLLAAYFVGKMVSRRVSAIVCKRIDETLGRFIGKTIFYATLIVAGTIILPKLGIQVSGIMAVLATAGFAIGLAFQGTLSNFSAGILLLVFRPFKVGDQVTVAGVTGKVNEIEIFTTTLDTPDNRRLILPNSSIAGTTIENISHHPHRRVDVTVGVEYSASLDATRQSLAESVESMVQWIIAGEGRGSQIILSNLGSHSVEWIVRIWVAQENCSAAREALTCQIKRFLDQYQIGIPHPMAQVHVIPATQPSWQPSSAQSSPALAIPKIHSPSDRVTPVRPRSRSESVNHFRNS